MEFRMEEKYDTIAKMKVIGIGGAGGNAVNRMVSSGLTGVEFIAVNTDAMALNNNRASIRIQIGEKITKGLGAGANPEIGRLAMEEDRDKIVEVLKNTDMLFITAGMGGGTGTGGAPVVAEIAREMDILTVAIVTRPFNFEGKVRDRNARKGIEELRKYVDTIIVIPNQKLLSIVEKTTTLIDAFKTADDVLYHATKGISDLITVHGLVNLDFADVRTIMKDMGDALMGSGFAEGENRAVIAADMAIHSPLLDDISIKGAKGILINITGGEDMTLYDVNNATNVIQNEVGEDSETNIIFGAVTDPNMNGKISITVIATGFNSATIDKHKEEIAPKIGLKNPTINKGKDAEQIKIPFGASHRENRSIVEAETEIEEMRNISLRSRQHSLNEEGKITKGVIFSSEKDIGVPPYIFPERKDEKDIIPPEKIISSNFMSDTDVPTYLRKQMQ